MICPHCRDVAAFKDHRDKTFTTLLGDVRVEVRPYYHCSHCHCVSVYPARVSGVGPPRGSPLARAAAFT